MLQTEEHQLSTEDKYIILKQAFGQNQQQMFDEQRHDLLYELKRRDDVSIAMDELLLWPIINRDEDGWRVCEKSQLKFTTKPYQCIQGFSINVKNGEFQLDLQEGKNPLFTLLDLDYILKGGIDQMFFSLDPPKDHLQNQLHVCNELRYGPWTLSDGDILSTLFHTDYLLKMFTVGVEIQCQYPYKIRSVYDGLFNRLPYDLKEALKPLHLRGINLQSLSRFWIESDVIEINQQQNEDIIQIQFGSVKMIVRQHLMKRNEDGSLADDDRDPSSDKTSEQKFANEFTSLYDRIAEYFPEYDRLKEISKMLVISKFLKQFKKQFMESKLNIQQIENILDKLQEQVSKQYPQVQKFDEIFLKHLQSQGINDESKVEPNNLKLVKQQVKQQLQQADEQLINQLQQVLSQQFQGIKLTNIDIVDWLEEQKSSFSKELLKKKLSQRIQAHMQSQKQELEALMNQVFFEPLQEQNQEYVETQDKIRWVPAAYLSYESQQKLIQIYGGVTLNPNAQSVPIQKIIDFYNTIQNSVTEKQTLSQQQYLKEVLLGMNGKPPQQENNFYLFKKEIDEQLQKAQKTILQQIDRKNNTETNQQDKQQNQQKLQVQNQQKVQYEIVKKPAVETLKGQGQEVKRVNSSAQTRLSCKVDQDIDIQFVNKHEKPFKKEEILRGVVPADKNGRPIGKSGVTVGNGYDIGQHSVEEINRLDISENLKQKLKPYCQVKKENAQQLLKQKPLILSEQEVEQINRAVHPQYQGLFLKKMQKYPEFYNSLNSEQKTALYDFSYQQGAEKLQQYFERAFEQNDIDLALQLLENFTNQTSCKSRNKDRIKLWKSGNNQKPKNNQSLDYYNILFGDFKSE